MNIRLKHTKLTGIARFITGSALATAALVGLTSSVQSESMYQVTLSSLDGKIELSGEITGIEGKSYVLTNAAGTYKIPAVQVRCTGVSCPTNQVSHSVFATSGQLVFASNVTAR